MPEGGELKMKAVVLKGVTKAEDAMLSEVPVPKAVSGWATVKIKAFGLNHSEQILRLDEIRASYIKKPIIPGIECAGEIADPSDTDFKIGQKVIALMGGMGRSFNGSYAEYALIPKNHVGVFVRGPRLKVGGYSSRSRGNVRFGLCRSADGKGARLSGYSHCA